MPLSSMAVSTGPRFASKLAVTVLLSLKVTVHWDGSGLLSQLPATQPVKVALLAAVALTVTEEPAGNAAEVVQRHEATGKPVVLIGWSLGGFMAREVARDLPNVVERVITMGSPIIGGPKYTVAAPYFARWGQDLDWIELEIRSREERPITQPIHAIISKTDGIVDWQAAIDRHSPDVEHIEVDAAHLGMGFNQVIWSHITTILGQHNREQAAA